MARRRTTSRRSTRRTPSRRTYSTRTYSARRRTSRRSSAARARPQTVRLVIEQAPVSVASAEPSNIIAARQVEPRKAKF